MVTKKMLIAEVAKKAEMSKKEVAKVLSAFEEVVVDHLKKGDEVKLFNLGVLRVVKRKARKAYNPQTGKMIKVPAKKYVRMRVYPSMHKIVSKK